MDLDGIWIGYNAWNMENKLDVHPITWSGIWAISQTWCDMGQEDKDQSIPRIFWCRCRTTSLRIRNHVRPNRELRTNLYPGARSWKTRHPWIAIWKVLHLYYGIQSNDDTGHPFHSETPHQSHNPPDQEYAMCKPAEESSETAHNLARWKFKVLPLKRHPPSHQLNLLSREIISLSSFPGDHENRVDYSLLSSSPVFSYSSKLDLCCHPVKSPQQDLFPEQDVFPEPFNRDCHSSQVPQQCISLPVPPLLSSESQIYLTDASYTERSDSATRYSDTVSDALDELPNSVD